MPRAFGTLAVAAFVLVFQGCTYLIGDPYGDYMQKAVRWVNLRSGLQNQTGLTLDSVSGLVVTKASSGGIPHDYVFIMADFSDKTSRIKAFGYDGLDLLEFETYSSGGVFSPTADVAGDIKIDSQCYYADSLTLHWSSLPIGKVLIADTANAINYMLYTSSGTPSLLYADQNDMGWTFINLLGGWQIGSTTETWSLARASVLGDGRLCLLFFSGSDGQPKIQSATFTSIADFAAAFAPAIAAGVNLLDSPAASVSARVDLGSQNSVSDNSSGIKAWITVNGVVSMTTSGNNINTFSRYPLGPGNVTDSYSLTSSSSNLWYFEPSGSYWYFFDVGSGRLVRLRTWWK